MRFYIFLFLLFSCSFFAQPFPSKPHNYVTDLCHVLSQDEQKSLNQKLRNFEDSTSIQILVYIDSSLRGNDMSQLCQNIFHSWKIGQKGKNNGVLVALFIQEHQFRIHTGYGLEGALPDLLTNRIQTETMRPWFKQGLYYYGINAGLDSLIYYCGHEFSADDEGPDYTVALIVFYSVNALALLLFFFMLFHKRAPERSPARKTFFITLVLILALLPLFGAIGIFAACSFISPFKKRGNRKYWSDDPSSWSGSTSSSDTSSSSSSDSSFDGGGGGDSGGGGSNSDW